jgi:hypothetical protein
MSNKIYVKKLGEDGGGAYGKVIGREEIPPPKKTYCFLVKGLYLDEKVEGKPSPERSYWFCKTEEEMLKRIKNYKEIRGIHGAVVYFGEFEQV